MSIFAIVSRGGIQTVHGPYLPLVDHFEVTVMIE